LAKVDTIGYDAKKRGYKGGKAKKDRQGPSECHGEPELADEQGQEWSEKTGEDIVNKMSGRNECYLFGLKG
jgi:hypothetical protein